VEKAGHKPGRQHLDKNFRDAHTDIEMQLSGNKGGSEILPASLLDLRRGDEAVLSEIDLPVEDARRLMELGFLPGARVVAGQSAPGGDPRVFQVDGSEIAVRRETAGASRSIIRGAFRGRHERVFGLRRLRPGGGCHITQRRS
jgi:ferrous iron transport protein A